MAGEIRSRLTPEEIRAIARGVRSAIPLGPLKKGHEENARAIGALGKAHDEHTTAIEAVSKAHDEHVAASTKAHEDLNKRLTEVEKNLTEGPSLSLDEIEKIAAEEASKEK